MSSSDSNLWNLVKSAIFPLDYREFSEYTSRLVYEIKNTKWIKLFNRVEGIALLIFIFGILSSAGFYVYQYGIKLSWVQTLGVPWSIGLVAITTLVIIKTIIEIIKSVNNGETIFGDTRNDMNIILARLAISGVFLVIPAYILSSVEMSIRSIVFVSILVCMVGGSFAVGFTSILTTIFVIGRNIF